MDINELLASVQGGLPRGPMAGPNVPTPLDIQTSYDGPEYGYAPVPEVGPAFTESAIPEAPTGFMARLGQSFADQPVPWHPVRGSSGTNMALGFLLSRVANAMGGKARREEQNRNETTQFVQRQNVMSDAERRAARTQEFAARLAERRAANEAKAAEARQAASDKRFEELQGRLDDRQTKGLAALSDRQDKALAAKTAPGEGVDYSAEADAIESGERTLTDFSFRDRKGIQDWMTAHGQKATPPKVREARQIYEQATFAIDGLEELSKAINTESSPGGRAKQAAGATWSALTRSETNTAPRQYQDAKSGLIPILSRLVGHVGVLTQKDVDSVMQMLPGFGEGPVSAGQKWARVRAFLAKKVDAAEKGYATKNAGDVSGTGKADYRYENGKLVPVGK